MSGETNSSRILGAAFLLQFFTSFVSGVFLRPKLIVPGDIPASLINIANNASLMRACVLLDMLTALGIIFLGATLFLALRKQSETIALVAFGFYVLEAVVLAVSRIAGLTLVSISQEFAAASDPSYLQAMGKAALEAMNFGGSTMHMLTFGFGGILFYSLMYKLEIVPHVLSLWGLVTTILILIATLMELFGFQISMIIYVPYMPFELIIGIWILFRGIHEVTEPGKQPALNRASIG